MKFIRRLFRAREEKPTYISGWTYRHAERAAEAEARHIGPYGRKEIVSRPTRGPSGSAVV